MKKDGVYWWELDRSKRLSPTPNSLVAAARRGHGSSAAELFQDEEVPPESGASGDQAGSGSAGRGSLEVPHPLEVAEEDPQPEGGIRNPRRKRDPPTVSKDEMDERELTHVPFRSWCPSCIAGKATEDWHQKRKLDEVSRIDLDIVSSNQFCARSQRPSTNGGEADRAQPTVLVDVQTGCAFATPVGPEPYAVAFCIEDH